MCFWNFFVVHVIPRRTVLRPLVFLSYFSFFFFSFLIFFCSLNVIYLPFHCQFVRYCWILPEQYEQPVRFLWTLPNALSGQYWNCVRRRPVSNISARLGDCLAEKPDDPVVFRTNSVMEFLYDARWKVRIFLARRYFITNSLAKLLTVFLKKKM